MKRKKVIVSLSILGVFFAAFFLLPLPVSRISETGYVQVQEKSIERVYVVDPGFLDAIYVRDGQFVEKGQDLAEFSNPKFDAELARINSGIEESTGQVSALTNLIAQLKGDANTNARNEHKGQLVAAQSRLEGLLEQKTRMEGRIASLKKIKAPRRGQVMSPPHKEEIFKYWEKSDSAPFCSIGDPGKLRIIVPVDSRDYRLLRENLDARKSLEVSIHVRGRTDKVFTGRVTQLPETHASDVPIALTHRGGGSLAVKPSSDTKTLEPIAQTYLVVIDIDGEPTLNGEPDPSFFSGTLVKVQIHTKWKSMAWWIWRGIASALDLGLI